MIDSAFNPKSKEIPISNLHGFCFLNWYLSKVIKLKIIEQFVIPPLCNN